MISKYKKHKKRDLSTVIFSVLLGVLVFGILGYLIYSNIKISFKRAYLTKRVEELKKQLNELKEKEISLKKRASYVENDQFLEERAREVFDLKKKGEDVISILFSKEKENEKEKNQQWSVFNWDFQK